MMDHENIGVIIIGRNEGERLARAFQSIKPIGVRAVYVDSASTDDSVKRAEHHDVPVVELGTDKPLSAARARNAGFQWFKENVPGIRYLHLLDGDCDLAPNWLEIAIRKLKERDDLAVVTGRLREKDWDRSVLSRLSDIGWYLRPGDIMSCGGIVTMKADVFVEVGGFDEDLIAGEEPEFYKRIRGAGYKLTCLEEKIGEHDGDIRGFGQWWTRTVRTGFSYANAAEWGRWERARRSLIFWGGLLPGLIILSSFLATPLFATLLSLLYPIQILRIFVKLNIPYSSNDRLLFAFFCILSKFPEFLGFLKYHYAKTFGKKQEIIEYKDNNGKKGEVN